MVMKQSTSQGYACPLLTGDEFEAFMIYCSDNICCAPEVNGPAMHDSENLSCNKKDYDHRSDLVDPEELYKSEIRAVASDLEAEYDMNSCDSSISSAGSLSSNRDRVRVYFDASLASAGAAATSSDLQENNHHQQADARSEATEKSARFNEALNTTIEYVPSNNLPRRRDDHDDDDVKSEGGRVNIFAKTSLAVLDQHRFDLSVLGTSFNDLSAKPHVLSSSIIDALQDYLPYTKRGELFWLKYSMVRDGASMHTMLRKARSSEYTILALETLDGEVFGAFVGKPWQITWSYYGSQESFLWRLRGQRSSRQKSRAAEALLESDIEVFPFAGQNTNIQLCNANRIAVGGGSPDDDNSVCTSNDDLSHVKLTEWGFGLAFGEDLQQGTSSPCLTFESPALSKIHHDGSRFEVANLEIWTLTPCSVLAAAERVEAGKARIGTERCMTI